MENVELITALCKAQSQFKTAIKDAQNPFFKSNYADLNSVWDACKHGLSVNDLFVSQLVARSENKPVLKTRIYHKSGGYIESEIEIVCKNPNDPQSLGSGITYMRRYSLAAILGIIVEDDDGEVSMDRKRYGLEDIKTQYKDLLSKNDHVFNKEDKDKFAEKSTWKLADFTKALAHVTKLKKEREHVLQLEHSNK